VQWTAEVLPPAEVVMFDVLLLALFVGLFGVGFAYLLACDRV
jgi:hypothetical protein